jgi:8-oxo-dGTP diphosphatase
MHQQQHRGALGDRLESPSQIGPAGTRVIVQANKPEGIQGGAQRNRLVPQQRDPNSSQPPGHAIQGAVIVSAHNRENAEPGTQTGQQLNTRLDFRAFSIDQVAGNNYQVGLLPIALIHNAPERRGGETGGGMDVRELDNAQPVQAARQSGDFDSLIMPVKPCGLYQEQVGQQARRAKRRACPESLQQQPSSVLETRTARASGHRASEHHHGPTCPESRVQSQYNTVPKLEGGRQRRGRAHRSRTRTADPFWIQYESGSQETPLKTDPSTSPFPPSPENTRVAGVILWRGDRVLLQQRDNRPDIASPGKWAIFGGHVEPGEDPEHAARREIEEELELKLSDALSLFHYSLEEGRERFFFAAELTVDLHELTLHEGENMELVAVADLDRYALVPLHRTILHGFFAHRALTDAQAAGRR